MIDKSAIIKVIYTIAGIMIIGVAYLGGRYSTSSEYQIVTSACRGGQVVLESYRPNSSMPATLRPICVFGLSVDAN